MTKNHSLLRWSLYTLGSTAFATGLLYPAWSAELQSSLLGYGYGGYADLSVSVQKAPSQLVAGQPGVFELAIHNAGPDPAPRTIVQVATNTDALLYDLGGCVAVRAHTLQCEVATAIEPDSSASVVFSALPTPDARGQLVVGGAADIAIDTQNLDPDPTNNSFQALVPLLAQMDLHLVLLSSTPTGLAHPQTGEPLLQWRLQARNRGPSTARLVSYQIQPFGPVIGCTGLQGSYCPINEGTPNGLIRPGGVLNLVVTTPMISPEQTVLQFTLQVQSAEPDALDGPDRNTVTVTYTNAIFADGVE